MITYTCDQCEKPIERDDLTARHVVIGLKEMPDRKSAPVDFKNSYKPAEEAGRDYCGQCVQSFAQGRWKFKLGWISESGK